MASSSSSCSALSFQSSPSREPTPEVDSTEAHNALAPLKWDEAGWDYSADASDEEASLTDGEADLQFLAEGELEEDEDDGPFAECWGEDISSSEEEAADSEDEESSEEYPPTKRFRAGSWDDSDDDEDPEDEDNEGPAWSSDEDSAGSSADESSSPGHSF